MEAAEPAQAQARGKWWKTLEDRDLDEMIA